MRLIIFCRLLGLVLCGNAATVYFASQSIRLTVVATLACSLLLQMVYFASVLFLIWRSSRAGKAGQGAEFFDRSQEARYQSPDDDEGRNETQDVPQRNQTLGISLLLP
ncbi:MULTISPECIES: exopolysaccharide production repressor protein [Mesorhizobium]|uniref:exopolysaccharide production repressor protein n=1 Tax=Mesorhizobium TaxID=68287 RepID=UPI0010A9756A|nr:MULTISPECIES: exopolysaccharide production repressor protein [Mesorhizobium]